MAERDEPTKAYLAGIIDGEGCVSFHGRGAAGSGYLTPALQIANSDKGLIDWLHSELGGRVYERKDPRPTRRTVWTWCAFGAVAREIVREARPYLRVKHRQADLILRMGDTIARGKGVRSELTDEVRAARTVALAEMRALNKRGRQLSVLADHE